MEALRPVPRPARACTAASSRWASAWRSTSSVPAGHHHRPFRKGDRFVDPAIAGEELGADGPPQDLAVDVVGVRQLLADLGELVSLGERSSVQSAWARSPATLERKYVSPIDASVS